VGDTTIIQCNIRDITDRKRAEQSALEAVKEIRAVDESILNSIGDAVFACDEYGKISLFNIMAERMTGISAREAVGSHYNQIVTFIGEGDGKPVNDFITEAIKNDKITKTANHVLLVRKDGRKIPVANSAAPFKNIKGDILGCVVVFHDVTKERQVDKAKTEFVSLASHQLRTPLSAINWYSEMLLSEDVGKLSQKQ
jgi:PAS domain S-box-containing protein